MDPISLPAKSAAAPQIAKTDISKPANADPAAIQNTTQNAAQAASHPIPPGTSQSAHTARSNLAATPVSLDTLGQPQDPPRTLLPYGVTMLPDGKPNIPTTFAEPTFPAKGSHNVA